MVAKNSGVAQTTAVEWLQCTLADACNEITYGLTASASHEIVGPKFLRITDIVSGQLDWNTVPYVVADESTIEKYRLYDGDIVIARTGASTGSSLYVKSPPLAVFASYLVRLRSKPEFDARYISYYLKSEEFWDFIHGVLGDKSAQPNASASTMTSAPFSAPKALAEQRAIAHVLGTLDDKIELNRRMNETLDEMARALFKSWFVDFDPVRAKMEGRWRRGESLPSLPVDLYDLFPDRLVDSELGEIPEGWGVKALGDVADVSSGKRPDRSFPARTDKAQIPLWGGNGPMAFVAEPLVDFPILLTGRVGTLGSVFRITTPCWPSDNTLVVTAKSTHFFDYLFYQLERMDFDALNRGSTQPLLTQSDLRSQTIPAPPEDVLKYFVGLTTPIFDSRSMRLGESRDLAAQRDALLPGLVSGEVEVGW